MNQVTAAATAPERESKRNSEAKKSVERSPSPVIKRSSAVRDSSSPKKKLKYDLEEKDSWEDIVDQVQTVYKSSVQGRFSVEILWKDKTVSTHSNTVVNQKCPQKMISFYEKRLTFEDSD